MRRAKVVILTKLTCISARLFSLSVLVKWRVRRLVANVQE